MLRNASGPQRLCHLKRAVEPPSGLPSRGVPRSTKSLQPAPDAVCTGVAAVSNHRARPTGPRADLDSETSIFRFASEGQPMPRPEKQLTPDASPRDWFGHELRTWRKKRSPLTHAELGVKVQVSGSLIEKIEKGTATCSKDLAERLDEVDRKSTRLNSSHVKISYAVFCLKK